ncbi:hypothetical protein Leryth_024253 [Lithospermum erythrorhizon]|nr:hypothetical protein Leryth_024253 [Lithospermum erythrorhizon]
MGLSAHLACLSHTYQLHVMIICKERTYYNRPLTFSSLFLFLGVLQIVPLMMKTKMLHYT